MLIDYILNGKWDPEPGNGPVRPTPPEGSEAFSVFDNGLYPFYMIPVEGGVYTTTYGQTFNIPDFKIAQFEVDHLTWLAVMNRLNDEALSNGEALTPCWFKSFLDGPMESLTWYDCQEFIDSLNNMMKDSLDGRHFRLPTEAEWEYAARGGKLSHDYRYAGGNTDDLEKVCWCLNNAMGIDGTMVFGPRPVGKLKPNELGIYDMSGNVAEWCDDHGDMEIEYEDEDGNLVTGVKTIAAVRGGAWNELILNLSWQPNRPNKCEVKNRDYRELDVKDMTVGFRVVLVDDDSEVTPVDPVEPEE